MNRIGFFSLANLKAIFATKALFPIAGRPAITTKSPRSKPLMIASIALYPEEIDATFSFKKASRADLPKETGWFWVFIEITSNLSVIDSFISWLFLEASESISLVKSVISSNSLLCLNSRKIFRVSDGLISPFILPKSSEI